MLDSDCVLGDAWRLLPITLLDNFGYLLGTFLALLGGDYAR
jgi:hypothetical protein